MMASATKSQRLAFGLAAAGILFAQSPHCLAAIYKCTGPDGKVTYGDTPCAQEEKSQEIAPTPPARAVQVPPAMKSLPMSNAAISDKRASALEANQCFMKNYNEWIRAQERPLPDNDVRIAKQAEINHACRQPLGLTDLPSPSHGPEQIAFHCGQKRFMDWLKAPGQPLPDDTVRLAKLKEFIDDCRRPMGLPLLGGSHPIDNPKPIALKAAAVSEQSPASAASGAVGKPQGGVNGDPLAVLNALADRIYVIGETSGKVAEMIAAEASAADEIRHYVSSGSTDGLLAKEKGQQSPLAAAAYMGYPNVAAALLASDVVRAHINDADEKGVTPWIAATLSMRQSLWACNPSIWEDPFKFVPMLVTQPYYLSNPMPPYAKTREVLQKAGATSDSPKAKELWLTICKNQSSETRTKVQASADLQKTVQEVGAADLTAQILKLQKKAAEAQKK
jgi:hypothetical protein